MRAGTYISIIVLPELVRLHWIWMRCLTPNDISALTSRGYIPNRRWYYHIIFNNHLPSNSKLTFLSVDVALVPLGASDGCGFTEYFTVLGLGLHRSVRLLIKNFIIAISDFFMIMGKEEVCVMNVTWMINSSDEIRLASVWISDVQLAWPAFQGEFYCRR